MQRRPYHAGRDLDRARILRLWRYAESADRANSHMVSVVLGAVDFRNRAEDSDKNRERCLPLDWWTAMVNRLKVLPVAVRVPVVVTSVQKSVDWLKKSVASSLSSVSKVLGVDWPSFLDDLLHEGGVRMSLVRREQTESCDRSQLCY